MNQQYSQARDIAAQELREALASTEALLSALAADNDESVRELRARLTITVAEIKKQLGDSWLANARDKYRQARRTAASINQFTQRHPWSAVVIGAGVGVLIGLLIAD